MHPVLRVGGQRLGTFVGATGIILWSSETALVTLTKGLPPFQVVSLCFGAAFLLSLLLWIVVGANPLAAFKQPVQVWITVVFALVAYHACIYTALQHAAPTPAALLQGATPLIIVAGSALLPGERVRWWHVVGTVLGFLGIVALVSGNQDLLRIGSGLDKNLAVVAAAAALWGVYSLLTRRLVNVPTSAMGLFFAASMLIAGIMHLSFEDWVTPSPNQWGAIVALGAVPMGLALFFWDHGVKRGNLQALGAFAYIEPLIAALFVALVGRGQWHWSLLIGGLLIVGGAALAGTSPDSLSRLQRRWHALLSPQPVVPGFLQDTESISLGPVLDRGSRLMSEYSLELVRLGALASQLRDTFAMLLLKLPRRGQNVEEPIHQVEFDEQTQALLARLRDALQLARTFSQLYAARRGARRLDIERFRSEICSIQSG